MSAFPLSGNCYTKEDEKRELEQLTDFERESIFQDLYGHSRGESDTDAAADNRPRHFRAAGEQIVGDDGRREQESEDDEDNNNEFELSEKSLREFVAAIDNIKPFSKAEYFWYAYINYEQVVILESNFTWFIKCENCDMDKAALRLCEYWNLRVEIFGEPYAYQPLNLYTNDGLKDIIPFLGRDMPNICRILPDDDMGRTVICWDRTGMPSFKNYDPKIDIKVMYYTTNRFFLEGHHDASKEVVLLHINKSSRWDLPSPALVKLKARAMSQCMPFKFVCQHRIISSIFLNLIAPIWKFNLPMHMRLRIKDHSCILKNQSLLNDLATYGLQPNKLPPSIGGTYDEKATWTIDCELIMSEKRRMRKKQCIRSRLSYTDK